jgi:PTS system nitrogen regulatory IIA component
MVLPFFPDKKDQPKASPKRSGALVRPQKVAVSDILGEDAVLRAPDGIGKDRLLELLVAHLCGLRSFGAPEPFLAKVLEREAGISTTLDTGLSLPHARVESVPDLAAALALVPAGVTDPKAGDLPIRLMFLFFSPAQPRFLPLHLQLLRGVASLFQPQVVADLSAAPSPAAAMELIRRAEGR